jgi:hypothetical protein
MGALEAIDLIKKRFAETGNTVQIPMAKGGRTFSARISVDGIYVDNLGAQPFLPWAVFTETKLVINQQYSISTSDYHLYKEGKFACGYSGVNVYYYYPWMSVDVYGNGSYFASYSG